MELQGDLKRFKNGEPLPGTTALEDRIEQMESQAEDLAARAELLDILRRELPTLSDEAEEALALLVVEGNR